MLWLGIAGWWVTKSQKKTLLMNYCPWIVSSLGALHTLHKHKHTYTHSHIHSYCGIEWVYANVYIYIRCTQLCIYTLVYWVPTRVTHVCVRAWCSWVRDEPPSISQSQHVATYMCVSLCMYMCWFMFGRPPALHPEIQNHSHMSTRHTPAHTDTHSHTHTHTKRRVDTAPTTSRAMYPPQPLFLDKKQGNSENTFELLSSGKESDNDPNFPHILNIPLAKTSNKTESAAMFRTRSFCDIWVMCEERECMCEKERNVWFQKGTPFFSTCSTMENSAVEHVEPDQFCCPSWTRPILLLCLAKSLPHAHKPTHCPCFSLCLPSTFNLFLPLSFCCNVSVQIALSHAMRIHKKTNSFPHSPFSPPSLSRPLALATPHTHAHRALSLSEHTPVLRIYMYIYVVLWLCLCMRVCACMRIRFYVCLCMRMCACMWMCCYADIRAYIYTPALRRFCCQVCANSSLNLSWSLLGSTDIGRIPR